MRGGDEVERAEPAEHRRQSIEHRARYLLERARELGPTIAAAADEIERRRELPEPLVAALAERGLFRLLLPRSLGGAELPPAAYVPVVEEIAKADASAAWCLGQACGCTMTAAYLAPEVARGDLRRRRAASSPGARRRPGRGAGGAGRLPAHRKLELCQRQPSRDLARRPCRDLRRGRRAAAAARRQPGAPHPAVPEGAAPR